MHVFIIHDCNNILLQCFKICIHILHGHSAEVMVDKGWDVMVIRGVRVGNTKQAP